MGRAKGWGWLNSKFCPPSPLAPPRAASAPPRKNCQNAKTEIQIRGLGAARLPDMESGGRDFSFAGHRSMRPRNPAPAIPEEADMTPSKNLRPIRRALLSVSDKAGLVPFAEGLARHGVTLISTGGTAKALREAGLTVADVAEVTGFPEMMDGRVKTLHPMIHGGFLALRDKPDHAAAMKEHGIEGIDLLVCNLYPFEATVAKGAGYDETIENIDIGGPAMTRSAAKNHDWLTVVVDTEDYAARARRDGCE